MHSQEKRSLRGHEREERRTRSLEQRKGWGVGVRTRRTWLGSHKTGIEKGKLGRKKEWVSEGSEGNEGTGCERRREERGREWDGARGEKAWAPEGGAKDRGQKTWVKRGKGIWLRFPQCLGLSHGGQALGLQAGEGFEGHGMVLQERRVRRQGQREGRNEGWVDLDGLEKVRMSCFNEGGQGRGRGGELVELEVEGSDSLRRAEERGLGRGAWAYLPRGQILSLDLAPGKRVVCCCQLLTG
ncbi:hypothetical protein AMTR_s00268p00006420 [Amborella trichopoda]|uniref:Uncharacterized protein n=1 Tax=Amborella trichopoda TaxID=13333 RepID=W1PC66_AMBTC|nr:hypothetical protein AMTR_s00268p00006420 [Amborella trichopoda]